MVGQSLPDADHVSRYCRPSSVDEHGLPLPAAFQLRTGEVYLSVNWLEHLRVADVSAAVECVREAFRAKGYGLRPNGRFVVLNVGAAKLAVHGAVQRQLRIEHLPEPDDDSHAGIFGYFAEDLEVAVELAALVGSEDAYAAVS